MTGKMIILIGPSGVGKSTFLERAIADFPQIRDAVTCTTRDKRPGEMDGNPYFFVTRERFEELLANGHFIEHAEVHGQLYGTPYEQLEKAWSQHFAVIMDVDVQGARTFVAKFPQALTVFILPPNLDALRQRLIRRHGKPPSDLEVRMKTAEEELSAAGEFQHQLINDDFEASYGALKKLIEDYVGNR